MQSLLRISPVMQILDPILSLNLEYRTKFAKIVALLSLPKAKCMTQRHKRPNVNAIDISTTSDNSAHSIAKQGYNARRESIYESSDDSMVAIKEIKMFQNDPDMILFRWSI